MRPGHEDPGLPRCRMMGRPSLPLNGFRGPETRMDAGSVGMGYRTLRHFYRRKTIAFTGAGDGLSLRGGYSSSSIVNDHEQPSFYCARVERAGDKTLQARSGRQSDSATRPRSHSGHRARRLLLGRERSGCSGSVPPQCSHVLRTSLRRWVVG